MIESLNDLKSLLDFKIKEEKENISSLYFTYVRPYCASRGNYNEFITPNEILIQFPPGLTKIRRYLLQILLFFDIFHSQEKPDPLPEENMKEVLFLIRSIAPLAPVISGTILFNIFEELHFVHGEYYPQTISFLMKSIGLSENNANTDHFHLSYPNTRRVHYEDGESVATGLEFQPSKTLLQNYPMFQNPNQENNIIKKPKYGPQNNMKLNH